MIFRGYVFSKKLEMETGLTIVAPDEYRDADTHTVTYLLHAKYYGSESWVDNSLLPIYARHCNTIFVMPEGGHSFYSNMKFGQRYFDYIADELPEICKSIFNISSEREATTIMGVSMGGYGALKAALARPEQYSTCCTFSSGCLFLKEYLQMLRGEIDTPEAKIFLERFSGRLTEDFRAIFGPEFEWNPNDDLLELAKKAAAQGTMPKLFATCGTEDYLVDYNRGFFGEMKTLGFDVTYDEWSGKHDWHFFNESLKHVLKLICL